LRYVSIKSQAARLFCCLTDKRLNNFSRPKIEIKKLFLTFADNYVVSWNINKENVK